MYLLRILYLFISLAIIQTIAYPINTQVNILIWFFSDYLEIQMHLNNF